MGAICINRNEYRLIDHRHEREAGVIAVARGSGRRRNGAGDYRSWTRGWNGWWAVLSHLYKLRDEAGRLRREDDGFVCGCRRGVSSGGLGRIAIASTFRLNLLCRQYNQRESPLRTRRCLDQSLLHSAAYSRRAQRPDLGSCDAVSARVQRLYVFDSRTAGRAEWSPHFTHLRIRTLSRGAGGAPSPRFGGEQASTSRPAASWR
jgi:hypothetical protein